MRVVYDSQQAQELETMSEWYCLWCGDPVDPEDAYDGDRSIGFHCSEECLDDHDKEPLNE